MARFWLVLALLLASCDSPQIGEVGAQLCSNRKDDDHDGLTDCADLDCQNQDVCLDGGLVLGGTQRDGGGQVPEGGVIGPPLLVDSGIVDIPHMDSGTSSNPSDEDDSGMGIPVIDAGPKKCDPKCSATQECIDGVCKAVTANTSQTIAVHITHAQVEDTTILSSCLEEECSLMFTCCPIDPYVRVVQVHDSKETVIGSTSVIRGGSAVIPNRIRELDYSDSDTWTVNLAEGDLLYFQLFDDNNETADLKIFECKADLTTFDPAEQTCSDPLSGLLLTTISAELKPTE